MKQVFLFTLIIFLFISTAQAGDFRKANWGMTPSQVKTTEKGQPVSVKSDYMVYKTTLVGEPFSIMYLFTQNKLVRAKYYFTGTFSNDNKYVDVYENLTNALTKKYGKGEDIKYFDNDYYRDRPSKWGLGISAGKIAFFTKWANGETDIITYLDGENYNISCGVEYTSKELGNLEDEEKEKNDQDQL